jgi:hypothetical protein
MRDIVVYTAITQGYDTLKTPPLGWRPEAHFVAFLEELSMTTEWEMRPLARRTFDPCRDAKIYKILAHDFFPQARFSLWIDGSIQIVSKLSPQALVAAYLGQHDLAVFKHRRRNCPYKEGAYCAARGLDSRELIEGQLKKYRQMGYPQDNGLAECTVLLRRHTDAIKRFNETWYQEIQAHSRRDQLSFNFVAHSLGLKYAYFQGDISNNEHFQWLQNKTSRMHPLQSSGVP